MNRFDIGRLHQLKASTTMDLGISIFLFLYNVWPSETWTCCSRLGWSVICPVCC